MNKYFLQPVLFIRFSGISFFKKILVLITFLTLTISFNFNSASAQWIEQTRPGTITLKDVYFINENTGWACGNNDMLIKTTNGGTNWINISTSSNNHFETLFFFDANTGFAAGASPTQGRAWRTTNGGTNWSIVSGLTSGILRDIFFVNSSTGWILSNNGIYKTTDGGLNWGGLITPGNGLLSMYFINDQTGWCSGALTTKCVYKTTNGGSNWITQTNSLSFVPYTISFSDANIGRVTGENGSLYQTTNGGSNWSLKTTPTSSNIYTHYFASPSIGWIGGTNIYFTSTGGDSWVNQATTEEIRAISSVTTEMKYAVGVDVYKTTGGGFDLDAPTNLTATAVSTSQINLSWTDNSSDEEKFMIERKADFSNWLLFDSVNANITSYQNIGLQSNKQYDYRVYAKKFIFRSGNSNEVSRFTLLETPVNQYPADNAVLTADTSTFRWTAPTGAVICTLQVSTDTSFNNIAYQTTAFGSDPNSAFLPSGILQQSTIYYWRVSARNFSTYSNYSATSKFLYGNINYGSNGQTGNNLYYFANSTPGADPSPSKPAYSWRDTTGSINMILNGVAQMTIGEGTVDDGRFDLMNILPAGNSIRFFGTNYQSVYVGTSGVIAFAAFAPLYYEPTGPLPQSFIERGIYAFWKDLDFSDPDVPVNRLCYKVTPTELIITYMRAPNYQGNATNYVSFQVIVKHSASPAVNSKIEVMYNYDQTGSTFISQYNNNTLSAYMIGMQGSNNASQILQYRYLNHSFQLLSQGPMFGSNMALAFGPDQNTLPVELASFTSNVSANNVQLNWSTVMEENNSGFEIERRESSIGNGEWKKISFINGNGSTTETKNYSYEDRNVQSGNYKYRLKQIDYNGNFEYHELSGEVIVGVPGKYNLSQNYPNPFNPVTKINFEIPKSGNGQLLNVKLIIYDVTGRIIAELVNKKLEAGYYTVDFNGASLSSGIYFYRLTANDFVQTKKMLLIK